jgi:hypothetical protein
MAKKKTRPTAAGREPRRKAPRSRTTKRRSGALPDSTRYVSAVRPPHESFPQPLDGSIKVWRYLNLPRLVSLLVAHKLILTRVDLLNDQFEGSVTRGVYEAWKVNPHNAAMFARMRPELKQHVYVSCWHANNSESESMWRLYCGDQEGIALQTTYERLDGSISPHAFLGEVTYVDYSADNRMSNDGNTLTPFMHKRLAFQHEREIRVALWAPAYSISLGAKEPSEFLPSGTDYPVFMIDWDIIAAIDHVYVSPYAPEWFRDVVAAVLERFAQPLASRLMWSNMKGIPLY